MQPVTQLSLLQTVKESALARVKKLMRPGNIGSKIRLMPSKVRPLTIWAKAAESKLGAAAPVFARIVLVAPKLEVTGAQTALAAVLICCPAVAILAATPRGALLRLAALCRRWLVVAGAEAALATVGRRGTAETIFAAAAGLAFLCLAALGLGGFVVAGAQTSCAAVGRGGAAVAIFAAAADVAELRFAALGGIG